MTYRDEIRLAGLQAENRLQLGGLSIFVWRSPTPSFTIVLRAEEMREGMSPPKAARILRAWHERQPNHLAAALSVDDESGALFVEALTEEAVVAALGRLEHFACRTAEWEPTNLKEALRKLLPPEALVEPRLGDCFLVPLADGTWASGQVVSEKPFLVALTDHRQDEVRIGDPALGKCIALYRTARPELESGKWPIVGSRTPIVSRERLEEHLASRQGKVSYADGINLTLLADAYWGLAPWNAGLYGNESCFDDMLSAEAGGRPPTARIVSPEERREFRRCLGLGTD